MMLWVISTTVGKAIRGEVLHGAFPIWKRGARDALYRKVLESHNNGNVWVNYKNKKE